MACYLVNNAIKEILVIQNMSPFIDCNNPCTCFLISLVQFLSNVWLWANGLRHARPHCPSPTPGVYSNSYPSSQWCHPTVSSFVVPFSSCLQFFLASESFPMSQSLLNIKWPEYWSFSFSISPSNEYSGLISLLSKGLSGVFSSTTVWKHQLFGAQPSLWSNSHICTQLLEKS